MSDSPKQLNPSATPARAQLDKSLFHGIAWTGGVKWAGQLVSWASTLIVARLLAPNDYGLVSMASAYLGLITLFSEFGIGIAVITIRDLTEAQLDQLHTLAVILGFVGFAISLAVAYPVSWFFRSPQLPAVIICMSLTFVIAAFRSVPSSLLQRDMQFKVLSLIDGARAVVLSVVMVVLALAGFRYWTLVAGALVSASVSTILTLAVRRCGFRWPRLAQLKQAVTISWHMLVNRLAWYTFSNADFVVAGRVLGQVALGIYTVGWTVASTPVLYITTLVGSVTTAFFSTVQNDYAALRRYLLNLTEGLALLTFPLSIGLALVVNDFVLLVLGSKWQAAVPSLRLLALYASVRSITPLLSHVLTVTGDTRFGMKMSVVSVIAYPLAFYFGSHWGIVGIAIAWMVVDPLLNAPVYYRVFVKLHLPLRQYMETLRPAILASAFMVVVVLGIQRVLVPSWPLAVRFALQVSAGAAAYIGVLALFHRQRLLAFVGRLKEARSARGAERPVQLADSDA